MDRTDAAGVAKSEPLAPAPADRRRVSSGSQSKLSSVVLWVLLAAALFRIVTVVTSKKDVGSGAGLVHWMAPAAAATAARASGKPILYDFTAEWCGPCHVLDTEGWSDAKVAAMVNESYMPALVVDRMREEGTNPGWLDELQHRYRVSAFPTLVVAAPDGREIAISQGYAGKQKLIAFLEGSRPRTTASP
ncbi:MAG TPA: thioredoxin family protein [Thermoanaerobaculia bacterium]|jgi:thiol:disulfide interchange protein